jgi:hypothetical protein
MMAEETTESEQIRKGKLADLASGDLTRSTRALLYLTYEDPDRRWLEGLLLDQLGEDKDPQLRSLAVTCMGHLGRMRGVISEKVVNRLRQLLGDKALAGFAENALGDIESFARIEKSGYVRE